VTEKIHSQCDDWKDLKVKKYSQVSNGFSMNYTCTQYCTNVVNCVHFPIIQDNKGGLLRDTHVS
jgi:hypothetical protein